MNIASTMRWIPISEDLFFGMGSDVAPAFRLDHGYLRGGCYTETLCPVTKRRLPAYVAFVTHAGRYYQGQCPLTVAEFTAFDPACTLGAPETPARPTLRLVAAE